MSNVGKLEKKYGKYAIRNLSLYLVIGYAIGYILMLFVPKVLSNLTLVPAFVMQGQVWRLVTWIITPPAQISVFVFIMLYFYYSIGSLLEKTIGTFLFNIFIIGGMLITMAGSMLTYIFCVYVLKKVPDMSVFSYHVNTYYICMSLFLAVAVCYPDMQVLYAMIIPVRMKWLALLYLGLVAYSFYVENFMGRVNIVLSIINFMIFLFLTRKLKRFGAKQIKRRRDYSKQVRENKQENVTHKCAVCGITDKEAPNMQFRYCSRCSGNKEYCEEHLFTHTHS